MPTGTGTTYDGQGVAQENVDILVRLTATANAYIVPGATFTITSGTGGAISETFMANSTYEARRGTGEWVEFEVGTDDFELPAILGGEHE